MKAECLAAAGADGHADVWFQIAGMKNELRRIAALPNSTFTVREAYEHLARLPSMPQVVYTRLPIADETGPPENILTDLVEALASVAAAGGGGSHGGAPTAMVFNCQMGRGRTTTAMVCATIMLKAAQGWRAPAGAATQLPAAESTTRDLAKGEFHGLLKLLVLLDDRAAATVAGGGAEPPSQPSARRQPSGAGMRAKLLADECIAECSEVQHLVTAIGQCKADADAGARGKPAEFWLKRGGRYLERYALLVVFAAYVLAEADRGYQQTFTAWFHKRWQLVRVISELSLA